MELTKSFFTSKRERFALYALILCVFIPSYNYFINELLQSNLGMESVSAYFYLVLALIGAFSYTYLRKVAPKLFVIIILISLGLIISYFLYPEIGDVFWSQDFNPLTSAFLYLPFIAFPMMIYSNYLSQNIQVLIDHIRIPSIALILLAVFDYYWTVIIHGNYFAINYMSFSYSMLPAVCFSFAYGLNNRKALDVIIALLGLIVVLIIGSRGCFLCGFLFCAIASIKHYTLSSTGRLLAFLGIALALFISVPLFFPTFTEKVMSYLDQHGATSRTLQKMVDGTVSESDDRTAIYVLMTDAIEDKPLGYGLMGDRFILAKNGNQGYAHSIIYEFLVDYGIVLGPLLILILFYTILHKHIKSFKQNDYYVLAAFTALGFIKLFFSGSYLAEPFFWALIGLLIKNKNNKMDYNALHIVHRRR